MSTLVPSRRALVATALALVVSLSLAACSSGAVGCLLAQYHGTLAAENGELVVKTLGDNWDGRTTVRLHWPDGWTVLPTDGREFAVLDDRGTLRVRTGTRVILLHPGDRDGPVFDGDGAFMVCDATEYAP